MSGQHAGSLQSRPFCLSDAMILVAATAVAFAALRLALGPVVFRQDWRTRDFWYALIELAMFLAPACLAMWSLAMFAIGLRQPRPRFRRLLRQPGFVASLTAAVGSVATLIPMLVLGLYRRDATVEWYLFGLPGQVGLAIVATWIVQAISGAFRPDRSWIDRCGRALGVAWVVQGVVSSGLILLVHYHYL